MFMRSRMIYNAGSFATVILFMDKANDYVVVHWSVVSVTIAISELKILRKFNNNTLEL